MKNIEKKCLQGLKRQNKLFANICTTRPERSVYSFTCPFDQRTMCKHLHTSSLLIIAESMDVHPNPGPTALHILKDFTSPQSKTPTTETYPLRTT